MDHILFYFVPKERKLKLQRLYINNRGYNNLVKPYLLRQSRKNARVRQKSKKKKSALPDTRTKSKKLGFLNVLQLFLAAGKTLKVNGRSQTSGFIMANQA